MSAPSVAPSGLGATPAVQISVRQGRTRSSVSVTVSSVTLATETPRETFTPRRCMIAIAFSPSRSPSSGISLGAMSTRCHLICETSSPG